MVNAENPSGDGLHRLVTDIFAAESGAIGCEQAQKLIGLVADQLLSEEAARERYPDLSDHLRTCADCTSIYRMVTEYAQLEASGDLPNPPRIPSMPAELRQTKGGWAGNLFRVLFPGFAPAAPSLVLRGRLDIPPVTVALGNDDLQIELQVQTSSASADLRTLRCSFVQLGTASGKDDLIVTATLERELTGEVEQTQTRDLSTGILFLDIEPEQYRIHLGIGDRDCVIEQVAIP